MAKRRALKPRSEMLKERAEKVRNDFARLKEQGLGTEDAVHRLRVKYKLGRTSVYSYIKAS